MTFLVYVVCVVVRVVGHVLLLNITLYLNLKVEMIMLLT